MFLFKYLDLLPAIPVEFLRDPIPNFSESNIRFKYGGSNWYDATYTRWGTTPELVEWLRANISDLIDIAGIQVMSWPTHVPAGKRRVNPHCDKRQWALNYVYETGGAKVATTLYREKGQELICPPSYRLTNFDALEVVESVVVEPCKWHLLSTNVLHGVTNVDTTRKAVTIGLNIDNPFTVIKGYENMLL
jgi:hypothetical protein